MGESCAPCKSLDRLWIIGLCGLEASQRYLGLDPTCEKYKRELGVLCVSQEQAVSYL